MRQSGKRIEETLPGDPVVDSTDPMWEGIPREAERSRRFQDRYDAIEAAYMRGPRKTGFVFMKPEDVEWLLHELRKARHEIEERLSA